MNEWTKEQRRIAAADLAYRGAVAPIIRMGLVFRVAADIADAACDAESDYALMLERLNVAPADIDAACAAIARGEHPPDSLPGQLLRYRGKAKREGESVPGSFREHYCEGEVKALGHVLGLLGCKVPG